MKEVQFREAICEAMSEEMRKDESIYLIGEEVAEYNGAYKASKGMLAEFGAKRVIDAPIAELGFAGISIGAAMNGNRPIVEFMTWNFSLVAIDQILNNAAKMPRSIFSLFFIGDSSFHLKGGALIAGDDRRRPIEREFFQRFAGFERLRVFQRERGTRHAADAGARL